MVLFGLVWFDWVWLGLVWFGVVWFGLVWFGLVWFVWIGLVWFGLVLELVAGCTLYTFVTLLPVTRFSDSTVGFLCCESLVFHFPFFAVTHGLASISRDIYPAAAYSWLT